MRRWKQGAALAALALVAAAPSTASAHGVNDDGETDCAWMSLPQENPRSDSDFEIGAGGAWYWHYSAHAGPHSVFAELEGETWMWGFPSVSRANSGDGLYLVTRIMSCSRPVEDIEANGKNQFRASAALDADEVARALGSMDIWAAIMRSHNDPPRRFRSHAAGGVECTATPRANTPDGTIEIGWGGIGGKVSLYWSSGASASVIYDAFDSGSGGRSPETINTLNKSSVTLDLDSFDTGSAYIDDSKVQLRVYGTCDGACKVIQVALDWNTY